MTVHTTLRRMQYIGRDDTFRFGKVYDCHVGYPSGPKGRVTVSVDGVGEKSYNGKTDFLSSWIEAPA